MHQCVSLFKLVCFTNIKICYSFLISYIINVLSYPYTLQTSIYLAQQEFIDSAFVDRGKNKYTVACYRYISQAFLIFANTYITILYLKSCFDVLVKMATVQISTLRTSATLHCGKQNWKNN